jgi:hypothetical protein
LHDDLHRPSWKFLGPRKRRYRDERHCPADARHERSEHIHHHKSPSIASFAPKTGLMHRSKPYLYSITSSARASSVGGTSRRLERSDS